MEKQEILYVDATPDEGYPLRILEAYRERCNYKWSTTSSEIDTGINKIMGVMNDAQDERANILDKAIAILRERISKPYWMPIPE